MSPALKDLIDSYSDMLIRALETPDVPDYILAGMLFSIDETQELINKGLIR